MKIYNLLSDFLEDYYDDLGFGVLTFIAANVNFVQLFLIENGWGSNDFFVGLFGQAIYIILFWFLGKQAKYKTKKEHFLKRIAALFLGGVTAMVAVSQFSLESSLVTLLIGFSFQIVWERFLMKYIEKLLPDSNETIHMSAADDGEDRPNDPPR